MLLERVLPEYDFRERHGRFVAAPPADVERAVRETTPGETPLLRALFALRSLPALVTRGRSLLQRKEEPIVAQLLEFGFTLLAEQPGCELVVGLVAQPWKLGGGETVRIADGAEFAAFHRAGFVKGAMNFHLRKREGGTDVETETRVVATDAASRRRFARYWLVIRPASGAVRRSWLSAIKRRAETVG